MDLITAYEQTIASAMETHSISVVNNLAVMTVDLMKILSFFLFIL